MVVLLIVSIAGVSIKFHFCQGELAESCVFNKELSYSMISSNSVHCEKIKKCCKPDKDDKDCRNGCCDQKSFKVQVDQDFLVQQSYRSQLKLQKSFVFAYVVTFFSLNDQDFTLYKHLEPHIPPPLVENKRILHQSFLL